MMQTIKTKDGFYIQPGMKIVDKQHNIYEIIDMDFDGIVTRETWPEYQDDGTVTYRLGIYAYFNPYDICNMFLYV